MQEVAYQTIQTIYERRSWSITEKQLFSIKGQSPMGPTIVQFFNNILGIKEFVSDNKDNYYAITIICGIPLTPNIKKVEELDSSNIEIYSVFDLQNNIVDHVLQPKFFKVTEQQELEELWTFNKNKQKFGFILVKDPIARYYWCKPGDYIRIHEPDGEIRYRLVR